MASYENGCPCFAAVSLISSYTRLWTSWLTAISCKQKLNVVDDVSKPARKNTNTFEIRYMSTRAYVLSPLPYPYGLVQLFLQRAPYVRSARDPCAAGNSTRIHVIPVPPRGFKPTPANVHVLVPPRHRRGGQRYNASYRSDIVLFSMFTGHGDVYAGPDL